MLNLLVLLFAFVPLALTASVPDLKAVLTNEKPLSDMMFNGTIHGVAVQLNGTAESIYGQFKQIHPEVVAEYERHNPPVGSVIERNNSDSVTSRSDLEGRQTPWANVYPPYCYPVAAWGWVDAQQRYINQGISYLDALSGPCLFGPMARSRVSCSYSAAIFFDWDRLDGYISVSCSRIGGMAQDLVNLCSYFDDRPGEENLWWTCGQDFNVVVRYDKC